MQENIKKKRIKEGKIGEKGEEIEFREKKQIYLKGTPSFDVKMKNSLLKQFVTNSLVILMKWKLMKCHFKEYKYK